jgi:hypothetical protein
MGDCELSKFGRVDAKSKSGFRSSSGRRSISPFMDWEGFNPRPGKNKGRINDFFYKIYGREKRWGAGFFKDNFRKIMRNVNLCDTC